MNFQFSLNKFSHRYHSYRRVILVQFVSPSHKSCTFFCCCWLSRLFLIVFFWCHIIKSHLHLESSFLSNSEQSAYYVNTCHKIVWYGWNSMLLSMKCYYKLLFKFIGIKSPERLNRFWYSYIFMYVLLKIMRLVCWRLHSLSFNSQFRIIAIAVPHQCKCLITLY